MSISFDEAPIPTVTRSSAPNPYLEAVASLVDIEKSLSFVIERTKGESDADLNKRVASQVRLIQQAGTPVERTVRVTQTDTDNGVRLTFWTRDKIVHGPRTDEQKAVAAAKRAENKAAKDAKK